MKLLKFNFSNGKAVEIDVDEFGEDRMGQTLDRLAIKHGGIAGVEVQDEAIPAQGVENEHGLTHGDHPSGISLPSM